jgi:hypothetical protein
LSCDKINVAAILSLKKCSKGQSMRYIISLGLIGLLTSASTIVCDNTLVIGQHGCGFFSSFFGALNNLMWCEKNNKVPYIFWDKSSLYYDERDEECKRKNNAWTCFFKQVSDLSYQPGDYVHNSYFDMSRENVIAIPPNNNQRTEINALIARWIHVQESILKTVEDYYERSMAGKKTVGIHIRRTDKKCERPHIELQKIFDCANSQEADQYLLATDEQDIVELAKAALKRPVITFQVNRSCNGYPIHYNPESTNKTQAGREVLIEVLLLSKTDFFVHTISNVSTAVIYFNPQLPHIELF